MKTQPQNATLPKLPTHFKNPFTLPDNYLSRCVREIFAQSFWDFFLLLFRSSSHA